MSRKEFLTNLLSRVPIAAALAAVIGLGTLAFAQSAASAATQLPAPAPYVSVTELLGLPDFIPGAGSLYIDPANAPVGPWLSYGKDGNLIEILYMVPVSSMQAAENWEDLSLGLLTELGLSIDHVDISFNAGHAGMAEPHYHFRLVLVDAATQDSALTP